MLHVIRWNDIAGLAIQTHIDLRRTKRIPSSRTFLELFQGFFRGCIYACPFAPIIPITQYACFTQSTIGIRCIACGWDYKGGKNGIFHFHAYLSRHSSTKLKLKGQCQDYKGDQLHSPFYLYHPNLLLVRSKIFLS